MATAYRVGLISTTPWPDQNDLFLNIVICEIRKFSQISVWNTNFFPSKVISKIRLVLLSSNAGDTPYPVCFDLDNSLNRWKRPIFKIWYSRNSKISVWNTQLFHRQAIAKIPFFLHSTQGILNTLVRLRQLFDPMKKIFFQNSLFAKLANFQMKT